MGTLTRVLTLEHQQDDAADQRNDADDQEPPAAIRIVASADAQSGPCRSMTNKINRDGGVARLRKTGDCWCSRRAAPSPVERS
jgi:hypothetical protein